MNHIDRAVKYIRRTLHQYGMVNNPIDEIFAFASGLRDGEEDKLGVNEYVDQGRLDTFYRQGFKHGQLHEEDKFHG